MILIMVLFGVHAEKAQIRNNATLHMEVVKNFDGCCKSKPNGWFHRVDDGLGKREKPSAVRPRAVREGVYASCVFIPVFEFVLSSD